MTPDLQTILNDKKVRYTITGFFALFVFFLILWIIITILKPATLNITPTNMSLTTGVTMSDEKIINYNGSSFIEVSPIDESAKVIYTPKTNFPYVKGMTYAPDRGILLTFGEDIEQTPVSDYKIEHSTDISFDDVDYDEPTSNYTWYLDFKTDQLKHISDQEINQKLTYYNPSDQMFYFVTGDSLVSYDATTDKLSTITDKLKLSEPRSISPCGDALCIVGQSTKTKTSLLEVSTTGQISTISQIEGSILPTPDPMTYAFLTDQANTEDDEYYDDEDGAAPVFYETLELANLETEDSKTYDGWYSSTGSIGEYNNHFYFAGGTDNTYSYLKSSSHDMKFKYDDDEYYFDEGFTPVGTLGQDIALVADSDNQVFIVSTASSFDALAQADTGEVSKRLDTCAAKVDSSIKIHGEDDISSDYEVSFEIMIPDEQDFHTNIQAMNTCIAKDIENLVGYSYTFTGFDQSDDENYY